MDARLIRLSRGEVLHFRLKIFTRTKDCKVHKIKANRISVYGGV